MCAYISFALTRVMLFGELVPFRKFWYLGRFVDEVPRNFCLWNLSIRLLRIPLQVYSRPREHIVDYFFTIRSDYVKNCLCLFPKHAISLFRESDCRIWHNTRWVTPIRPQRFCLRIYVTRNEWWHYKRFSNASKSTSCQWPFNRVRNVDPMTVELTGTKTCTTKTLNFSTPSTIVTSPTVAPIRAFLKYHTNNKTKCFNYNGFGHISPDCPKPRRPLKCSVCDSDQHFRGRCPNRDKSVQNTCTQLRFGTYSRYQLRYC